MLGPPPLSPARVREEPVIRPAALPRLQAFHCGGPPPRVGAAVVKIMRCWYARQGPRPDVLAHRPYDCTVPTFVEAARGANVALDWDTKATQGRDCLSDCPTPLSGPPLCCRGGTLDEKEG